MTVKELPTHEQQTLFDQAVTNRQCSVFITCTAGKDLKRRIIDEQNKDSLSFVAELDTLTKTVEKTKSITNRQELHTLIDTTVASINNAHRKYVEKRKIVNNIVLEGSGTSVDCSVSLKDGFVGNNYRITKGRIFSINPNNKTVVVKYNDDKKPAEETITVKFDNLCIGGNEHTQSAKTCQMTGGKKSKSKSKSKSKKSKSRKVHKNSDSISDYGICD